jgi:ketosteroid isomerase-like protein
MSQENVEAFKRALEAYNRRDIDSLIQVLDPEVEWHSALLEPLEGEAALHRGHEGVRDLLREAYEVLAQIHLEISEIRDLGDRIVGIARLRTRGRESGAETELPLAYLIRFKDGKAISVRTYLDPREALEAAGLSE